MLFSMRDSIYSRKVERGGLNCRDEERSLGWGLDIWGNSPQYVSR